MQLFLRQRILRDCCLTIVTSFILSQCNACQRRIRKNHRITTNCYLCFVFLFSNYIIIYYNYINVNGTDAIYLYPAIYSLMYVFIYINDLLRNKVKQASMSVSMYLYFWEKKNIIRIENIGLYNQKTTHKSTTKTREYTNWTQSMSHYGTPSRGTSVKEQAMPDRGSRSTRVLRRAKIP